MGLFYKIGMDLECDVGFMAVVGAGAMMAGSGRLTLFFTVVVVEITNDLTTAPPIAFATLVASFIGNQFNHGYYHEVAHVQALPILEDEPNGDQERVTVSSVMSNNPVKVVETMTGGEAFAVVYEQMKKYGTKHQGFPVVDGRGVLTGLVSYRLLDQTKHRKLFVSCFMDCSPLSVRPSDSLGRTLRVFRRLGCRHIPVVNDCFRPVGIITRSDLLPWSVAKAKGHSHGEDVLSRGDESLASFGSDSFESNSEGSHGIVSFEKLVKEEKISKMRLSSDNKGNAGNQKSTLIDRAGKHQNPIVARGSGNPKNFSRRDTLMKLNNPQNQTIADIIASFRGSNSMKNIAFSKSMKDIIDFEPCGWLTKEKKAAVYLAGGIRGRKVHSITKENYWAFSWYYRNSWRSAVTFVSFVHIFLAAVESPRPREWTGADTNTSRHMEEGENEKGVMLSYIRVMLGKRSLSSVFGVHPYQS